MNSSSFFFLVFSLMFVKNTIPLSRTPKFSIKRTNKFTPLKTGDRHDFRQNFFYMLNSNGGSSSRIILLMARSQKRSRLGMSFFEKIQKSLLFSLLSSPFSPDDDEKEVWAGERTNLLRKYGKDACHPIRQYRINDYIVSDNYMALFRNY